MEDRLRFSDALLALSPLLATLWLLDLCRVLRGLTRISPAALGLTRRGMANEPLPVPPLQRVLAGRLGRSRYPRGVLA